MILTSRFGADKALRVVLVDARSNMTMEDQDGSNRQQGVDGVGLQLGL